MSKVVEQTPPSVNSSDKLPTQTVINAQMRASELPVEHTELPVARNAIREFVTTRRNLPHWQNPGSIYFITFRTYNKLILNSTSKQIIYDNIIHYSKFDYDLFSFVIMPDHVHIILQPKEIETNKYVNLSKIMQAIKGYAAKQILKHLIQMGKHAQTEVSELPIKHIFQAESFDRIIRNDEELFEKMNYILNNPVKRGLIENGYNYKCYWDNSKVEQTPPSVHS
ncbi:MAG: transposase [Candidatus Kapabacteria bacterium]|nr:transposase [Candidatus Kapabacteria bacterium]